MASAALTAAGRYKIAGVLPVDALFNGSLAIGRFFRRRRLASEARSPGDVAPVGSVHDPVRIEGVERPL